MKFRSVLIIIFLFTGASFGSPPIELRLSYQAPQFGNNYLPQWLVGRSITFESGVSFSSGVSLGCLFSYLKFPFNPNQQSTVDAGVYSTEAGYLKIAGIGKVDAFHSSKFSEKFSPYGLAGVGVMKQNYVVKGYSWGDQYIDSRKNWLYYLVVGFGLDLFQNRRISYFIDYRYEQELTYNYNRYDRPLRFGFLSGGLQMNL